MTTNTTNQEFFEAKYRENSDPWAFASSDYEHNRYSEILHALDHRRYRRAFEPGCSIGILTAGLASICKHVDAIDISPSAAGQARQYCAHLSNVNVSSGSLPSDVPAGTFEAEIRALSLRHLIEQICTDVLRRIPRAFGPFPLAMNEAISLRYQELDLYLRQSHAERDLERLGTKLRERTCRELDL
jgi:hypothetical protein